MTITSRLLRVARACVSAVLLFQVLAAPGQKPVRTESGDLLGTRSGGVRAFLGVRYAAPPVGALRWKAPQPVQRSAAALPADHLGASCMQKLSRSHLPWTEEFMVQNNASEDCLFLNVWAPARQTKPAPVLVFVHGGAYTEGSGGVAVYDGSALAKRGLVVVDINYRLGIFGFFADGDLARESTHGSAGNYGLLDTVAALAWVQRNIAAFGGDPSRVAVAGQSAGAQSVLLLMASPLAKGLFQRAMVNSGSRYGPNATLPSAADAQRAGDAWAAAHGGSLAALRALGAEQLLAMQDVPTVARAPVLDGWMLPVQPLEELRQPVGSDVPVMAGWTADEGSSSPLYGRLSAAEFRADAVKRYGGASGQFLQLYPAATEAEAAHAQIAAARDRNFAIAALWTGAREARRGSPVYLYYFDRVPPWKAHPEFRAHHTAELPYFFGTLDRVHRDYTAEDRAVSDAAAEAWVRFCQTGNPGPQWQPAASTGGPFFELGDTRGERPMLDAAHAAFWRSVLDPSAKP